MLVLITLITLIGAYLIASRLTRTSAELSADRDQRTQAALQEAKAALIAFAANPNLLEGTTLKQLGSLPCPDRKLPSDTLAGQEESSCDTDAVRIGRLPWKTLNLSSELRDGSGEQLWYVLSANFRKKSYPASGYTTIYSDTQGQIAVTGAAPATNVVALIIAPGLALGTQNRDKTSLTALNDPSNYLEGTNSGANDNAFETRAPPNDKDSTGDLVFNDRVLALTHADLFAAVEPVVAHMTYNGTGTIDVRSAVEAYRTTWGRYPFAAPFTSPGTSSFQGTAGTGEGLLPITSASAFLTWQLSTTTPAFTPTVAAAAGNPGTVDVAQSYTNCSVSTTSQLECKANWCGPSPNLARIQITAKANNAGLAFARSFVASDFTVDRSVGGLNSNWSTSSVTIYSSTYSLDAAGVGTISLELQLPTRGCTSLRTIRVRIPVPPYHSITTLTDPNTGWFAANQWHKVTYYAVAPDLRPGGGGSCATTPPCLTVNGLPGSQYPTINDKNAVLILMGRSLNGSSRPSGTLANYLEGQNASTGDNVFEHRMGAPGAVNDRVVVISP